jgi:hypothetical protein
MNLYRNYEPVRESIGRDVVDVVLLAVLALLIVAIGEAL